MATIIGVDESVIAPLLNVVSPKNPQVYLKSRVTKFALDAKIKITVSYSSSLKEEVFGVINKAIEDLKEELGNAGILLSQVEK